MKIKKFGCLECDIPYNCSSCSENNQNYYDIICDVCRTEIDVNYCYNDQDLCEECLLKQFKKFKPEKEICDNCFDKPLELFIIDDEKLCRYCTLELFERNDDYYDE